MIQTLFTNPVLFLFMGLSIVIAITIHEYAHARMADYLGDPTPRIQGRITLNPTAHIDLYGILFLLIIGFGWGKPVQFDPFNLDKPKRDAALISFAGPLSNFILAIICAIILRLFIFFDLSIISSIGLLFLTPLISMNVMLGVFNLLPIHPFDGFKIVGGFLNNRQASEWYQLERYGIIFLLLLIIPFGSTPMIEVIMRPIMNLFLGFLLPSMASYVI